MNYEEAQKNITRTYTVKDGYAGKTAVVGLAFLDGIAIEISNSGYYRTNGYKYSDEAEMLYYFDNHKAKHFPQAI